MKIDDTQDYSSDIAQLDKDTEVAQLYLDEAKEKLSRYQITASEMVRSQQWTIHFWREFLNRAAIL